MTEQPNPNELLLITREELERCCSQMSAAGYKVSANYVEASVLSRSLPAPAALETEHEQYERICKEVSQEQHDATIRAEARREEREKTIAVLKWLYGTAECVPLKEDSREYDKGFHQAMSFVRGWIKQKCESLRWGEP